MHKLSNLKVSSTDVIVGISLAGQVPGKHRTTSSGMKRLVKPMLVMGHRSVQLTWVVDSARFIGRPFKWRQTAIFIAPDDMSVISCIVRRWQRIGCWNRLDVRKNVSFDLPFTFRIRREQLKKANGAPKNIYVKRDSTFGRNVTAADYHKPVRIISAG